MELESLLANGRIVITNDLNNLLNTIVMDGESIVFTLAESFLFQNEAVSISQLLPPLELLCNKDSMPEEEYRARYASYLQTPETRQCLCILASMAMSGLRVYIVTEMENTGLLESDMIMDAFYSLGIFNMEPTVRQGNLFIKEFNFKRITPNMLMVAILATANYPPNVIANVKRTVDRYIPEMKFVWV